MPPNAHFIERARILYVNKQIEYCLTSTSARFIAYSQTRNSKYTLETIQYILRGINGARDIKQ